MDIKIQAFESLDSTNNYLKKLAAAGAPEGTVIVADEQTAGRGRMGHSFCSAPGVGIYMSILMRPQGHSLDCTTSITAMSAVAVCRAIERVCGVSAGIKWINDVYLRGKKICGILCESATKDDLVSYVISGIGVNVSNKESDFPEEIRSVAGSIYTQTGIVYKRSLLIAAIADEFNKLYLRWLEGPTSCLEEYRRRCIILGRSITLTSPEGDFEAVAENISADYGLVLRLPDGSTRTVHSGEVRIKM